VSVVLFIVIIILAGYAGYMLAPEKVEYRTETVTDTVTQVIIDYQEADPITVTKTVTVHDTVYVTGQDTIQTDVASIDTVFADEARISVDYYISPKVFDLSYTPGPVKTIEKTIYNKTTTYVDTSAWWNKAWVGVAGSAVIVFLLK
jgi:hypothetical protein